MPQQDAPERLSFDRLPDVDDVVLTERGEAKRYGDWSAADLRAAIVRLMNELEGRA